jgi:hypothetical protein
MKGVDPSLMKSVPKRFVESNRILPVTSLMREEVVHYSRPTLSNRESRGPVERDRRDEDALAAGGARHASHAHEARRRDGPGKLDARGELPIEARF